MEIEELVEEDRSSSDNENKDDCFIEEPDDNDSSSRSSSCIPSFICKDSTVFTNRDHIEIDEYETEPDSDEETVEFQRKQLVLKEVTASKGDQSFVSTQQYSPKVQPKDFRKSDELFEIAKLDNRLFEQFKDVPKDSIPLDIIEYIESVLGSVRCWNASYVCEALDETNIDSKKCEKLAKFKENFGDILNASLLYCGSIDWRLALHGFTMIEVAQNDRINELICNSILKILTGMPDMRHKESKGASLLLHEEVLRVFQLLPLFHMFRMTEENSETSQDLISALGSSILKLSGDALNCLKIWWGCTPNHYFKNLVHIFKKSIELNLIKQVSNFLLNQIYLIILFCLIFKAPN